MIRIHRSWPPALRQLIVSDPDPELTADPELGEGLSMLAQTAPNGELRDCYSRRCFTTRRRCSIDCLR